jgi:hypothetical protein
MSKPIFAVRAVEMHGDRMWSWRWAKRAIDFAAEHRMNALVFHQNDIIDLLTFPHRYFTVEEIWARWPVRYHNIDNNLQYLRAVIRAAADVGVTLFLNVKEISFHDSILLKRPELWRGQAVCASDPFWWEFLEAKLEELLDALPDLGGLIVSPATRETRLTISANECTCERCQATTRDAWYESLIRTMFQSLDRRGKILAVRDFSYTSGNQGAVLAAATRVSEQIVISLKNTPHDYYPTFPDNPRIGDVGRHPQWAEFDTWGQFYGLGAFPSIVLDDMKLRFRHCVAHGVTGVIGRTDWEVISDGSVFDTLNLANLAGFGRLCWDPEAPVSDLIANQLQQPMVTFLGGGQDDALFCLRDYPVTQAALQRALEQSWELMAKTIFVLRHVFHEDCMFPDTLRKAFMMLVEIHSLAEWDPSAKGALNLDAAKLAAIYQEKDEAVAGIEALAADIAQATANLPPGPKSQLRETFDLWTWYARGFRACARACFATRHWLDQPNAAARAAAVREIDGLDGYRAALISRLSGTRYAYLTYWLLDTERLRTLVQDLRGQLDNVA